MLKKIGCLYLSLLWCVAISFGQGTTGTISGIVKDGTGAVIPGADVLVQNKDTGISRKLSTDVHGRYSALRLALGEYEISADAAGFQQQVRSGIVLTVGREATVDFTLQVGTVSEAVTVTGEAPLIETTNATVSNLVSEREMRELPLNGRSFTDLTSIQPGVVTDLGVPSGVFQGGGRMVINGARPQQSLYLLDATDIVSPYSNVAPVSVMNQTLGVDTIREFNVLQNNYGAQYGRAIGGIVNAVTRSGTNTFHGSAFEFFRSDALDAKNFFDLPDPASIPPFKRNQFGGTLGGPIVKDNAFFFFSYEGLRQSLGTTDFGIVMSDQTKTGQITGCPSGMKSCAPAQAVVSQTVAIDPNIKPLLQMIPQGNGQYLNDGLQEFFGSRRQTGRENYYMFRIDEQLTPNDSIFGRTVIDRSSKELPDAQLFPDGSGKHTSTNDVGGYAFTTIEWTRILSATMLNVARVGFSRNNNRQCMCLEGTNIDITDAASLPAISPSFQIVPGVPFGGPWTIPGISIPGGHNGPGNATTGADLDDPLHFVDNTFSYADSLHITKGSHTLEFGVDIRRYQENALANVWGKGQISWRDPMANFLTAGACSGCRGINTITTTGLTAPPDAYRGWRQTYAAWYAEDDFRLFPNLTLNLGLRWERLTAPIEVNGKVATIENVLTDSDWTQRGKDPLFSLRDSLKGLAPRFGFAYSPGQSTSIRGGFGIFKEMPLEYDWQLAIYYPPFSDRLRLSSIKQFPNPLAGVDAAGARRQPLLVSPDLKYPYGMQWNLGIERQLGQTWVAKVSYVGNRGVSLISIINQVQPALSKDDNGVEYTPHHAPSVNPFLDSSRIYSNVGDSVYNALQLSLQKRFSRGLEVSASYTWAKNISDVGMGLKGAEAPQAAGYQVGNLWNYKSYDRGLAQQDVRNNLIVNFTYELPFGQGKAFGADASGVKNALIGGWQVNGIVKARSGLPISITGAGYSGSTYCRTCSLRPLLVPNGDNNPVLGQIDHWFDEKQFLPVEPGYFGNVGSNTLSQPDLVNMDLSFFKKVSVTEGKTVEFRGEFFNVLNHPNFGAPNLTVFRTNGSLNPTVGKITTTRGTSRQIQLAVKFQF